MHQAVSNRTAAPVKGPYSQAIIAGNLVFVSGQVALTCEGELIHGAIEEETRQVMANLRAILKAAGLTFDHVVKTTIYLTDTTYFAQVNKIYGSYFKGTYPARETVGVAALPLGARVEISLIAAVLHPATPTSSCRDA